MGRKDDTSPDIKLAASTFIKSHKWKILTSILLIVGIHLFRNYERYFVPRPSDDAVSFYEKVGLVVLGGGLKPDGTPPEHTKLRLNHALEKYKEFKDFSPETELYIITLSAGTTHKPNPLDKHGFPITEAMASAKYLIDHGIPASYVMEENISLDTLGNAYFLRTMHADPGKFTKLMVITNTWHMKRVRAIFEKVFSLPSVAGGPNPLRTQYDVVYLEVASGLDASILKAREAREKESLRTFIETNGDAFRTMVELHEFIFRRHNAYSSVRLTKEREAVSAEVLASY